MFRAPLEASPGASLSPAPVCCGCPQVQYARQPGGPGPAGAPQGAALATAPLPLALRRLSADGGDELKLQARPARARDGRRDVLPLHPLSRLKQGVGTW